MKRIITLVTLLVMLLPFNLVSFADTSKAVNVKIDSFELQDDSGKKLEELAVGTAFKMHTTYTVQETVHKGDWFDVTIPNSIDLSTAFTNYSFSLKNDNGEVIANAVVNPNTSGGGTIRVTFNENADNKSNIKGNMYLYARGNDKAVNLNSVTPITIVVNSSNSFKFSTSTSIKFTPNAGVGPNEIIGKWAKASTSKEFASWRIRINKSGKNLKNVVITDNILSGNGKHQDKMILQKVTYDSAGNITSYDETVNIEGKVTYNADKTSFTLNLGDIGTQGYFLSYRTTVENEDPIQTNKAVIKADSYEPESTKSTWKYRSAGGEVSYDISNKLMIKKIDSTTRALLEGAQFKVTNKSTKESTLVETNNKGIALTQALSEGEYEVIEVKAPKGYKLSDKTYTVQITSSGDILTVKNDKLETLKDIHTKTSTTSTKTKVKLVKHDTPKTGDNQSSAKYLLLGSMSLITLIVILKRRKHYEVH